MNCQKIERLLSAYIDNELSGRDMFKVRAHLSECTHCQTMLSEVESIRERVRALSSLKASSELENKLRLSVLKPELCLRQKFSYGILLVAASVAFAFLAYHSLAKGSTKPEPLSSNKRVQSYDSLADHAFLSSSDPISGGAPVTTVSYAGGR